MHPIQLKGARTHNLKDVSVKLAPGELVVVVGPSGAGKSSLVFDTLYAEGQRRFVESMSPYARQFLERHARPDVTLLEPLPAAVAVDRQGSIRTSRSTVASLTDVADYAKSLWAKLARLYCTGCGALVERDTPELAADRVLAAFAGRRVLVCYSLTLQRAEEFLSLRDGLVADGYRRIRVAGETRDLDSVRPSEVVSRRRAPTPGFEVIVDRLAVAPGARTRLVEALEASLARGAGRASVVDEAGERLDFATGLVCGACGTAHTEPQPGTFSFNSPVGACEDCRGFGRVMAIDWDKVLDRDKSLDKGAILAWGGKSTAWERGELRKHAKKAGVPLDIPVRKLSKAQQGWLLDGDEQGHPHGFFGLAGWFKWLESRAYKMHVRVLLSRYRRYDECATCGGTRFRPSSLSFRVDGRSIADFFALSVDAARAFVERLSPQARDAASALLLREVGSRLSTLADVGLGYLGLDRAGNTLSGGETQRVALASALGASLTSTLFVLDEPTSGLHPRDAARLSQVVRRLADLGNLVLAVEHHTSLLALADRVIELGPAAGADGGQIVFDGRPSALLKADTETGRALRRGAPTPSEKPLPDAWLELSGATGHNLQSVSVKLPLGRFSCVTGPSGSGKTSLITRTLLPALQRALGERVSAPLPHTKLAGHVQLAQVVGVDKSPLGRTSRGNPATYLGVWDVFRKRFAAEPAAVSAGLSAGAFSFNVPGGRCEACKGQGFETVEMQFLADVSFACPECAGQRFVGPVRAVRHAGLDVVEVLGLTADAACAHFSAAQELVRRLRPLCEVGLGYLTLGQPLNTLSGGEAQRLKLARALSEAKPGSLLLLDEPTSGLSPRDVVPLLAVIAGLTARGDTVVVIEHDMRVAAHADWVIDLGPGAGDAGGRVVAQGTPRQVARVRASATAPFLSDVLAGAPLRLEKPKGKTRKSGACASLGVTRAREHNLKAVSVELPHDQLVVLTGPSGSGKSSLAFGVIFAEAQRRFIETLSPYARQYLPQLPRPDVDQVTAVLPALSLQQRVTRAGAMSTVATMTEIAHYLRLLYARTSVPSGAAKDYDAAQPVRDLARRLRSAGHTKELGVFGRAVRGRKGLHRDLLERARSAGITHARIDGKPTELTPGLALDRYREHDVDLSIPFAAPEQLELCLRKASAWGEGHVLLISGGEEMELLVDEGRSARARLVDPRIFSFHTRQGACETCEGRGQIVRKTGRGKSAREQSVPCSACGGTRLSELSRAFRLAGHPISHFLGLSVSAASQALCALELSGRDQLIGGPLVAELRQRLAFLEEVGLGYLGLDRPADSLSGGETQRVRLSAQLGSGLTGVLYVLDEPTIGLHPRDTGRLLSALRGLVTRGSSALVVEHDADTILAADHVIDMGPGGGRLGGKIVAQGPARELKALRAALTAAAPRPRSAELREVDWLELKGAAEHNLKAVDLRLPLGRFSAVTGVSGSGKSTLVRAVLLPAVRKALGLALERAPGAYQSLRGVQKLKRAVEVDQSPIGRTPRSVPATYVGIWDEIRKLLAQSPEARARGYDASRFSFNVAKGRCPLCEGNGALSVEMSFLPDALVPCEACAGLRFSPETLSVKFHGLSAGQLLELEVDQAAQVFSAVSAVRRPLEMLSELGLGYLKLGQASSTLSGGEAQRMKLVSELATRTQGPTLYVLDEPTTGLARADVARLLTFLAKFVERGDTVLVIEHHTDVMLAADYLVDLGPEGGEAGGTITASGTPEQVAAASTSHTGRLLAASLSRRS